MTLTPTISDSDSQVNLQPIHLEVQIFVKSVLSSFPGRGAEYICHYLTKRHKHTTAIRQDLMPLMTYLALGNEDYRPAVPLTGAWILYLAAAHAFDSTQDKNAKHLNYGVMALGAANVALTQLDAPQDTLRDILDALGCMTALGANAQDDELIHGRIWSRKEYLRNITGKAATIIATGIWIGGRLTTDNQNILVMLKEFGLSLGMAIQLCDDCLDLEEDLTNGTYTLPVIEALAQSNHPKHALLESLLKRASFGEGQIQQVVDILHEMEVMDFCYRTIRVYQVQTITIFDLLPGLRTYFSDYVASN